MDMPTTRELMEYLRTDYHDPNCPYLSAYDSESDVEILCRDIDEILQNDNKIINKMYYIFEDEHKDIEQLRNELKILKKNVRTLLFTKLKVNRGKMRACVEVFNKLNAFASKYGNKMHIITTNYDLLVEELCSTINMPISDGFERQENEQRGTWRNHWNLEDGSVELIKIHGSINWHEIDDGSVVKESNTINPLYDKEVFIAPTLSAKSYKGILKSLFQKFEDVIKNAHLLIVVGCSFRDETVNSVIYERVNSGKLALLSISPDSHECNRQAFGTTIELDVTDINTNISNKRDKKPIYSLKSSFGLREINDIIASLEGVVKAIHMNESNHQQ